MMSLIDFLQAEAIRLGFLFVGITDAGKPLHVATYEQWVAAGRHADMAYLATEQAIQRRTDPRVLWQDARSLLVVGMAYPNPSSLPEAEGMTGKVAAYAWGKDYHGVIVPLLDELVAQAGHYVGHPIAARSYTDTGAILERDAAQRAGLGWHGKNTCLIHPQKGSYFFLGEALLNEEVAPSMPFMEDRCGSCRRCIDACPTGCIRDDRTLDSGRCISYLTIENKGSIPLELRSKVGKWVFGCDICQQVCPWNIRFADKNGSAALASDGAIARSNLLNEMRLSAPEFTQKFRASPIRRTTRRGYLRNVAVALGNIGDQEATPTLASLLQQESESLVRSHIAWALGKLGGTRARYALETAYRNEPEDVARAEIRSALDGIC